MSYDICQGCKLPTFRCECGKEKKMRQLEHNALARLPLSYADVEKIWENAKEIFGKDDSKQIRQLCESHERLRMESQGLQTLNETLCKRVSELEKLP